MKFRAAVEGTKQFVNAYQTGLHALTEKHKNHLTCSKPRRITGSVNVENALKPQHPNDPLWDYCVGVAEDTNIDRIIWIEIHPAAKSQNIDDVIKKHEWLVRWLDVAGAHLNAMHRLFVWIPSGESRIAPTDPRRKKLALAGVQLSRKRFEIC